MKNLNYLYFPIFFLIISCGTLTPKEKLDKLFKESYENNLQRHPQFATFVGKKINYDKLNDYSLKSEEKELEINQSELKQLNQIPIQELSGQDRLSYQLFKEQALLSIQSYPYRFHNYPVNQMFGLQSSIPAFLINMHQISNLKEAGDYIYRIRAVEQVFIDLVENLKKREALGIIAPKFVWPHVIRDAENILKGFPFSLKGSNPIYQDFSKKLNQNKFPEDKKITLLKKLEETMIKNLKPAYEHFLEYAKYVQSKAPEQGGLWRIPKGREYYQHLLKFYTNTGYDAYEIHRLGMREVKRIHLEMKNILVQISYRGSLRDFFNEMKTSSKFYYPNNLNGRQLYLAKNQKIISEIQKKLDLFIPKKPKSKVVVKAVEKFREKSAGRAFYQPPTKDGSRPGIYYINLSDLRRVPKYEMEALAYHEAIPGHHLQNAIASELNDLPDFRNHLWYPAFGEGWALYAELIPKQAGFYRDPYSDFGRLSMELWRATRLVVDTGLHALRWSKEMAINYLQSNTPTTKNEIIKAVERYLVMPGQATAYKIGMIKILQMRKKAIQKLSGNFSLPEFHQQILSNGALPLDILEKEFQKWLNLKVLALKDEQD
jgi:uncharacterized protein (DUF885 family)